MKIFFVFISLICISRLSAQNCNLGNNNIGFENSTTSSWSFSSGDINYVSLPCNTCATSHNYIASVVSNTSTIGTQCVNGIDAYGGFPVVAPAPVGGNYSLLLNSDTGRGQIQKARFVISSYPTSMFPTFQFAAVLKSKNFSQSFASYFAFEAKDLNTNTIISCLQYNSFSSGHANLWHTSLIDTSVIYLPWQSVTFDLTAYLGDSISIEFYVSDGGYNNFGYAYIDANCNGFYNSVQTLCAGTSATLNGPPGLVSYNWTGPVNDTTQNIITSAPGTYTLTTTSIVCTTPVLYYHLNYNPLPNISYTMVQDTTPQTWDLYATYPANAASFLWDWGDGTISTVMYPTHTYSTPGKYNICLSVADFNGCTATFCQNDSVYRLSNNSAYSNMVYVNVLNGNQATGINQQIDSKEITIYPNPAQQIINVEFKTKNNTQTTIEIFNIIGECVHRQIATSSNCQINVVDLNEGVYNICITNSVGTINKKLLIVR